MVHYGGLGTAFLTVVGLLAGPVVPAQPQGLAVIDLWKAGRPAFGIYVPRAGGYTVETGEQLGRNRLYDFVFLNLEGNYEAGAAKRIQEGLSKAGASPRAALIVRIPPISKDGAEVTKARMREVMEAGADGVTIPHVRSVDEAKQVIGFFKDSGADAWSPSNPSGRRLLMLMLEDPGAVEQAAAIADLKGYSILACGIGSLRQALGGNRDAAEAGTQKVLAESKRAKLVNMLTATPRDVEQRVKEGFLALLVQGSSADETIKLGRAAARR